jgi:hypothetical protein
MTRLLVAIAILFVCGCGGFPSPFTAEDMAKAGTGEALIHYLHQPGATAAVCDRTSQGPRFRRSNPDDLAELTGGLLDGSVRPELWQRCTMLMLGSVGPAESAAILDAMTRAYRELLRLGAIEHDAKERAKLEALHRTFLLRPRGTAPHAAAVESAVTELRDALAQGRLGPVASRHARDALTAIDLDRGLWKGARITIATLDALQSQKDEPMLRRITMRVPDPTLQREARRRIVRLHIASSASRDVRLHADEIEAAVMETGRNPIDVTTNPPTSAWLDEQRVHVRGVLVRQDVWKQTATLLAYEGDRPGASVIPSLDLRGALYARAEGLSDPVTICAPPDALDVTPCLLPSELRPKVPIVRVDDTGLLHFVERITSRDAMRLVYNTPNLPLPFEIHGRALLTIEWPIVFERPGALVFSGPTAGRGPDLRVTIERRYSPRILFEVTAPGGPFVGVVEANDLDAFVIATQGGSGTPGTRGTDGASGTPGNAGMSASCPGSPGGSGGSGGPGGAGTSGGPGGPGGDGGDVIVHVACVTGACESVVGIVGKVVRSEGGAGGPGGDGGRGGTGGQGGPGGSGTSCYDSQGHSTYLSGGSPGMKGSDGSSGARGSNGPNGSPGRADIRAAP